MRFSPPSAQAAWARCTERDTRLNRIVAVNVLSADVAADRDRRARFERETRAIAALSHPHICTIHDVRRHEGIDYLVMEGPGRWVKAWS